MTEVLQLLVRAQTFLAAGFQQRLMFIGMVNDEGNQLSAVCFRQLAFESFCACLGHFFRSIAEGPDSDTAPQACEEEEHCIHDVCRPGQDAHNGNAQQFVLRYPCVPLCAESNLASQPTAILDRHGVGSLGWPV
jgi:hypothetical protein